jgi:hypothetical protein
MDGIPGDLYGRVQSALLRCGPFDSDRTLRPLFVDARLSAWRDLLPEAGSRVERAQAVIDALSQRANPAGDNALALLLRVLAENTQPGDACQGQLMALAQEVAAVARVDAAAGAVSPAQPSAGSTVFNQQGQRVGTQINVAGDYYAPPTPPAMTIIGDGNVVGNNNVVQVDKGAGTTSTAATSPVNVPALRALLQRFDAVEIESLCLDHFPEVYDKFTRGLQRGEMINLLLDHCRRHPLDAARLAELV